MTEYQGNMLDNPITTKDSHILESNGITAGATGMQGWRLEMEVRFLIPNLSQQTSHASHHVA